MEDKHPIRIFNCVQHIAAKNGHLDIYKFLHESLNDVNPTMHEEITPLHLAAQYGHFDVCKYICDNTVLLKPLRSDGNTPLTLAFHRGHIKIARLLHGRNRPMLRIALIIFFFLSIFSFTFNIYEGTWFPLFSWGNWLFNVQIFCFSAVSTPVVWEIVNDIRFTSPRLEY